MFEEKYCCKEGKKRQFLLFLPHFMTRSPVLQNHLKSQYHILSLLLLLIHFVRDSCFRQTDSSFFLLSLFPSFFLSLSLVGQDLVNNFWPVYPSSHMTWSFAWCSSWSSLSRDSRKASYSSDSTSFLRFLLLLHPFLQEMPFTFIQSLVFRMM